MPRAISSVPLPSGRRVALDHVAQVGDVRLGQIAAPVHAGEVEAVLVRAADEVAHRRDACGRR